MHMSLDASRSGQSDESIGDPKTTVETENDVEALKKALLEKLEESKKELVLQWLHRRRLCLLLDIYFASFNYKGKICVNCMFLLFLLFLMETDFWRPRVCDQGR